MLRYLSGELYFRPETSEKIAIQLLDEYKSKLQITADTDGMVSIDALLNQTMNTQMMDAIDSWLRRILVSFWRCTKTVSISFAIWDTLSSFTLR